MIFIEIDLITIGIMHSNYVDTIYLDIVVEDYY